MARTEFEGLFIETKRTPVKEREVLVVTMNGKVTNSNAFEISRKINFVFDEGIFEIILDLSALEYINSVGVATLLTLIKTVDQHNGKIVIGGLNHFLENVIRLMELPKKVAIYHTLEEAKTAFA
ncbi:STAS domain protein [Leptospira inadai serovar Lyme str. 10]|uniref:Anti-sigma factor antagonist n=2 Tax=Leptospira inadai serovar Lyme TaxID=293084 RepID=V6HSN9_9LEPT|nr:STAS domain-containing protein [Leptospira inadai]EQA35639.1 STAS domain protein [Leptospira inadai serovar Lyme str. 10]PNV76090.1 anti-sigma factor antagonist [Leptospira inadai serovar Lyme]